MSKAEKAILKSEIWFDISNFNTRAKKMAQFKTMLNSFSRWWYDNVSNRYEPSKHYFRGRL